MRERVVDHTRVVRGNTKLIQENRLILHVKPVINREVVVHRTNTIVKDVLLHRVNTTNKTREEFRREVAHRNIQAASAMCSSGVKCVNCNCDERGSRYSNSPSVESEGERVSYRQ